VRTPPRRICGIWGSFFLADGVLTPPPVEMVETVETCMRAGAALTPAPVETVETVEASTGGDTACSASLRLAGMGSAQRTRLSPRCIWRSFSGGCWVAKSLSCSQAERFWTAAAQRGTSGAAAFERLVAFE
jgi:hypothetical protein